MSNAMEFNTLVIYLWTGVYWKRWQCDRRGRRGGTKLVKTGLRKLIMAPNQQSINYWLSSNVREYITFCLHPLPLFTPQCLNIINGQLQNEFTIHWPSYVVGPPILITAYIYSTWPPVHPTGPVSPQSGTWTRACFLLAASWVVEMWLNFIYHVTNTWRDEWWLKGSFIKFTKHAKVALAKLTEKDVNLWTLSQLSNPTSPLKATLNHLHKLKLNVLWSCLWYE